MQQFNKPTNDCDNQKLLKNQEIIDPTYTFDGFDTSE